MVCVSKGIERIVMNARQKKSASPRVRRAKPSSSEKLHQITFCSDCGETIPAKAIRCFRCNAKQVNSDKAVQVVFCEQCGKDYPAKANACFHCGQLNPRSPYLKGRISS